MEINEAEMTKQKLVDLNIEIGEREQQGVEALAYFSARLSDQLIFRRASGKVVGKWEAEGFLASLKNNPFSSRCAEDISVTLLDGRALVTLIVVGARKDDGSIHRYRNVRLFSRSGDAWILECWYNYEITNL